MHKAWHRARIASFRVGASWIGAIALAVLMVVAAAPDASARGGGRRANPKNANAKDAGAKNAASKFTMGLRYPSLTPDNKHVVFSYRGDIWRVALDRPQHAQRLTIHEAVDSIPRVSPDGKHIAFTSRRSGGYDIFVMPIEGGLPKQITHHSGAEIICTWSPDGKRILFAVRSRGDALCAGSLRRLCRRWHATTHHDRWGARRHVHTRRQAHLLRARLQYDLPR